ncbi:uncharacterized protein DS421_18g619230 [Arachis hypogaea]|nr:uncharacterized protein DS421_18g619230 [Arachis hypogaea]
MRQSQQHSSKYEFWQLHGGGRWQGGCMAVEELGGGWRSLENLAIVGNIGDEKSSAMRRMRRHPRS